MKRSGIEPRSPGPLANILGPGDLRSIPGRVIPKAQKMVLDASLLNTQYYKGWSNPGKGVAPSPTTWCSSYQKGSLQVTLDYSCHLYLLFLLININYHIYPYNE